MRLSFDAVVTLYAGTMSSPLALNFLQSASRLSQLPDRSLELAFVGRSNVGKSSLINALANRKKLAKISKSPGATQLINIYELQPEGSGKWLVDLPGYGFAKAPKKEMERWRRMIEEYLIESPTLGGVYVLIDSAVGPTALDLQTVEWLEHIDLSYRFVATKIDKIRSSKSSGRRSELVNKLGVEKSDVVWVSASSGAGIPRLRSEILDYFA